MYKQKLLHSDQMSSVRGRKLFFSLQHLESEVIEDAIAVAAHSLQHLDGHAITVAAHNYPRELEHRRNSI